jgi:transcriptional regulator with XRE-family HTH domain
VATPKHESKGSRAFAALMPEHGDQLKMAQRLGCAQDQVSRWASGGRKPEAQTRALLEDKLGIPWRDWDEPPAEVPHDEAKGATGTEG